MAQHKRQRRVLRVGEGGSFDDGGGDGDEEEDEDDVL